MVDGHAALLILYTRKLQKALHVSSKPASLETRNHILDTAWALISAEGADIALKEIAAAAGVSRQAVYLHFGSRNGLLMALVKRADERFDIEARLFASFAIADPHERLEKTVSVWLDFVVRIYPVASDLIRLRKTDEAASAAWEDRMAELRSWLEVLAASLDKDDALLPEWKASDAADYLWAAFSVQIWGLLTQDCGWSRKKTAQVLSRALSRSLLRDS